MLCLESNGVGNRAAPGPAQFPGLGPHPRSGGAQGDATWGSGDLNETWPRAVPPWALLTMEEPGAPARSPTGRLTGSQGRAEVCVWRLECVVGVVPSSEDLPAHPGFEECGVRADPQVAVLAAFRE